MTTRNRAVKSHRERIESRIYVRLDSGCWEWLGVIAPNGYGMLGIGRRSLGEKRTAYAHRLSYETFVGPIPAGHDLDHLCRNRCCCNPAHLEPVTRRENNLRGDGPAILSALNGSKTHCKNGHAFTPENTRMRPTGGRECKECRRQIKARYLARHQGN